MQGVQGSQCQLHICPALFGACSGTGRLHQNLTFIIATAAGRGGMVGVVLTCFPPTRLAAHSASPLS